MSAIVQIDGREAIPVRVIPFITGWRLSPLDVTNHFARIDGAPFGFFDDVSAYHLQAGSPVKMLPKEWDAVRADLLALEAKTQAKHEDENIGYAEWRKDSVRLLPAAVFVFKDEFEKGWARQFQIAEYQEQREGEHALNYTPLFPAGMLQFALEGFGSSESKDWREFLKDKRVATKAPPPVVPVRGRPSPMKKPRAQRQQEPDWTFWRLKMYVKDWEAAALSMGIDPDSMQHHPQAWMAGTGKPVFASESFTNEAQEQQFDKRYRLVAEWVRNYGDRVRHFNSGEIELKGFAVWVVENELPVPDEFAAIHSVSKPASATEKRAIPSEQDIESPEQSVQDWKEEARKIADELFDHDTELKTRDTLENYSKRVMDEMQRKEIHGPRGRIDNHRTIMREALQGEKWWSKKKK